MGIHDVLESLQAVRLVKEGKKMNFFPACHLHAGQDRQRAPCRRPDHVRDVFRRIVIADGDDVQFLGNGPLDDGGRIHLQTRAR